MENIHSWILCISLLLLIYSSTSEEDSIKRSLIAFLEKLSPSNPRIAQDLRWNFSTNPCVDRWRGIGCNNRNTSVRRIVLEDLELGGSIDASLLCKAKSLVVLSLQNDNLQGNLPPEISNCSQLTHIFLDRNRLSGNLPSSLSSFNNLKKFDVSDNDFSGEVPKGLGKISGLVSFQVQDNKLNGTIPEFDFSNLQEFNVSNNFFSGPIPKGGDRFGLSSYSGNFGFCGGPFDAICSSIPAPSPLSEENSKSEGDKAILFSGYILLGLFLLVFIMYILVKRKRTQKKKSGNAKESSTSTEQKASRSEYSISSNEGSAVATTGSMSLIVLKNPAVKELKFEELLKAPAELLGRGRFGTLYKVMMSDGNLLAVKRIKDWTISAQEFQRRMERLDRAKHPRVLSAIAFYCSKQEKLVVYEYKPNGSLFKLLHGNQENCTFDWNSRLSVAAGIAKGMSFMHRDLQEVGIGHGNLKSSNILMDTNMEPCISEYGLLAIPRQTSLNNGRKSIKPINDTALKDDIFSFGVILLELLTGKIVQNNGFDLAQWVHSVVREEWTVEVFDKGLLSEGVPEDRMVKLLQIALKCIYKSVDARPTMSQVAEMIHSLKEEEDRSVVSEIDSRDT
ncbi:uncharacterized protein A4U43_C05F23240 [Asparagus officinalis]|uniref:Protein kinase domain-containing protein n=1 Tax=Asparagus officinalis TaxID=4686 RepID=A0A5P1EU08_ASPOF|nr:probable inactive receptor kinase At2g26730 [Asparagus officinalis]ONK69466.1 uncharacterized protein A4U43_C05F23240 [Asparagus officinalis]